jgi:hypothetical protein
MLSAAFAILQSPLLFHQSHAASILGGVGVIGGAELAERQILRDPIELHRRVVAERPALRIHGIQPGFGVGFVNGGASQFSNPIDFSITKCMQEKRIPFRV